MGGMEYDPDSVTAGGEYNPEVLLGLEEKTDTEGRSRKKQAPAACTEVTGWRKGKETPEYTRILGTLRDTMLKYGFQEDAEIEIRLGHTEVKGKGKRFVPGIQEEMFVKIYGTLLSNTRWESTERHVTKDYSDGEIRITMNERCDVLAVIRKKTVWATDVEMMEGPFDFRVGVARETPVQLSREELEKVVQHSKIVRLKDRHSFFYKHWRYDLTMVHYDQKRRETEMEDGEMESDYVCEVELEVRGRQLEKNEFNALYLAESTILKVFDLAYMLEPLDPKEVVLLPRNVKIRPPRSVV